MADFHGRIMNIQAALGAEYLSYRHGHRDARHAAAEIAAEADALIAQLVHALKEAEIMFRWYGDLHAAKPDHDKAKRNYDAADKCLASIYKAGDKTNG